MNVLYSKIFCSWKYNELRELPALKIVMYWFLLLFDTKLATGYRLVVTVNMADDDLEYYIKFPSPSPKDATPTSETEEFVFVYDEDKLPVVMLLGWAGCQDKYLSKYSAIYEERG